MQVDIDKIRDFQKYWANGEGSFDPHNRAWMGKDSESYRVLDALIKYLEVA